MVRKKTLVRFLGIITVICFLFSQSVFAAGTASSTNNTEDLEYLKNIMEMIKQKYNGDVTDKQLLEGAVKGMFDTMDPYTTYFTQDQAKTFLNDMGGTYTGIGVIMGKFNDYIIVTKVIPTSPAEKAGISVGDKIISVDGKSMVGASLDEAGALIRGDVNTKVTVGILKSGETSPQTVELTRTQIKVNPVTYEIRNDIGYIRIDTFNANTKEYFMQALDEMDKKGIEKIVLDLRDNTGGDVKQAAYVATKFVPEGLITKLDFKEDGRQDVEYYSHLKTLKYKLVVLVNKMTASASEILAGAIQDTKAGTLVGTKTFGKGRVQNLIPLLTPEASSKYEAQTGTKILNAYDLINKFRKLPLKGEVLGWAKITTGEYYTPKGRMIDKQGLTPDIAVDDPIIAKDINIFNVQKLQITSKPGLNSESVDVYNAERILKLAGYDVDTPDMKLDEKTQKALMKFQSDNGGYPCGVLDFATQKWLNEKLEQMLFNVDKQYQKAVEELEK